MHFAMIDGAVNAWNSMSYGEGFLFSLWVVGMYYIKSDEKVFKSILKSNNPDQRNDSGFSTSCADDSY